MTETKQLVVVVEGTAALGPHWRTIVTDYLEKIIRYFIQSTISNYNPDSPTVEMALVNFNAHGSYSACLIQRSGWTKNMNMFLEWLSAINFSGGGFCDAAIAEGLAEVLMMFPSLHGIQNHQRHCILVAASNPYPLPTPIYIPPDYIEMQSDSPLSDAETVAQYFKKCLVSLSVICPRQLPKLRAIYNAAKRNPSETDPTIDIMKNPNYLVLISEGFMVARDALTQPEITNLPSNQTPTETDVTPVSGPPQTTSTNDNLQNFTITKKPLNGNPTSSGEAESATLPGTSSTTMPTSEMDSTEVNDSVATTVGPTQQTSSALKSDSSRLYVKLWEGDLTVESQGNSVFITKLQGYRNPQTSELIAKDWPLTMQIDTLIPEEEMINNCRKFTGKVDHIVFRALNEHSTFLGRLQEKKLCMVIKLPSQALLLCVTADRINRLVGMVLPQEMVKYEK
ncbi:mediator of RNA polymerase II transcription subunit 25 [Lactuca sativa]|uniref:mediator of RNA polymerase II transcription subunit 25 n=1 Tax=Lactuca sativa TaxID=4236 RepID=UPI0022B066AA|nr:mediator of RNA polymerase II transcription subunit 25 [Lactuca sativa]